MDDAPEVADTQDSPTGSLHNPLERHDEPPVDEVATEVQAAVDDAETDTSSSSALRDKFDLAVHGLWFKDCNTESEFLADEVSRGSHRFIAYCIAVMLVSLYHVAAVAKANHRITSAFNITTHLVGLMIELVLSRRNPSGSRQMLGLARARELTSALLSLSLSMTTAFVFSFLQSSCPYYLTFDGRADDKDCPHRLHNVIFFVTLTPVIVGRPRCWITWAMMPLDVIATFGLRLYTEAPTTTIFLTAATYALFVVYCAVLKYFDEQQRRRQFEGTQRLLATSEDLRIRDAELRLFVDEIIPPILRARLGSQSLLQVVDISDNAICAVVDVANTAEFSTTLLPSQAAIALSVFAATCSAIATVHGVHVIRTIGDTSTIVGDLFDGVRLSTTTAATRMVHFGFGVCESSPLAVRCGVAMGRLVGMPLGIVCVRYDIAGPALTAAQQLVLDCPARQVNVSPIAAASTDSSVHFDAASCFAPCSSWPVSRSTSNTGGSADVHMLIPLARATAALGEANAELHEAEAQEQVAATVTGPLPMRECCLSGACGAIRGCVAVGLGPGPIDMSPDRYANHIIQFVDSKAEMVGVDAVDSAASGRATAISLQIPRVTIMKNAAIERDELLDLTLDHNDTCPVSLLTPCARFRCLKTERARRRHNRRYHSSPFCVSNAFFGMYATVLAVVAAVDRRANFDTAMTAAVVILVACSVSFCGVSLHASSRSARGQAHRSSHVAAVCVTSLVMLIGMSLSRPSIVGDDISFAMFTFASSATFWGARLSHVLAFDLALTVAFVLLQLFRPLVTKSMVLFWPAMMLVVVLWTLARDVALRSLFLTLIAAQHSVNEVKRDRRLRKAVLGSLMPQQLHCRLSPQSLADANLETWGLDESVVMVISVAPHRRGAFAAEIAAGTPALWRDFLEESTERIYSLVQGLGNHTLEVIKVFGGTVVVAGPIAGISVNPSSVTPEVAAAVEVERTRAIVHAVSDAMELIEALIGHNEAARTAEAVRQQDSEEGEAWLPVANSPQSRSKVDAPSVNSSESKVPAMYSASVSLEQIICALRLSAFPNFDIFGPAMTTARALLMAAPTQNMFTVTERFAGTFARECPARPGIEVGSGLQWRLKGVGSQRVHAIKRTGAMSSRSYSASSGAGISSGQSYEASQMFGVSLRYAAVPAFEIADTLGDGIS